ncbi:MAG: phospholipid carrier-dependent glycosyltransferase [bacterium]|nr:phospholipid carrier-dependent glycosyltransferase [bacterium]
MGMTRFTRTPVWALAALMIAGHLALALSSARLKSATADEYTYISTAWLYDKTGDFRLDRTHPPLTRLLIGLPLQFLTIQTPPIERDRWDEPEAQTLGYTIGWAMLLGGENDPWRLLFWARLPVMLLSCGLAALIFIWARELYGDAGGLLSLGLYCLSPNLLAHARLATLDLGLCFFTVLALYAAYRYRLKPSLQRAALTGLALGLALGSKATALLLVPVVFLWMLRPAAESGNDSLALRTRWLNAAAALGVAAVLLRLMYFGQPFYYIDTLKNVFYKSLHTGEAGVEIPGMPHLNYAFYLLGEYSTSGWPWYYLAAMLFKTPLAAFAALAAILLAGRRRWIDSADGLIVGTFALILIASAFNRVNIGLRHILPVYALLYLVLGRAADLWRGRGLKAFCVALALWFIAASAFIYPDYLSYFNELAGGPGGGRLILDDSNLDWGQDLARVKSLAERHPGETVYIATNWMFDPAAYGFSAERLRDEQIASPPRGLVAVGEHWLIRHRINRRSPDYFDWLEKYEPIGEIGHSILVYRFE